MANGNSTAQALPQLGRTSPMLSYFCVYNPSLGSSEENTKDQILYYTAKTVVPADVKMKQVGLAQALVNFRSVFSPSQVVQTVHSQKNRLVFLQPEPGFWIHMSVELGILRKQVKDSKGTEKLVTEYLDAQLNDRALEAVLRLGYEQFKLLNGTMTYMLYESDSPSETPPPRQRIRSLMHSIEEFFSEWIWKWDFDRLHQMVFSAVFNGVPTLPVQRANYLKIHLLEQAVRERTPAAHLLVLDAQDGGCELVYRSSQLAITDVCALRKWICKRVEKHTIKEEQERQARENAERLKKEASKISSLGSFTKSLSQAHIFSYFTKASSSAATSKDDGSAIGDSASAPEQTISADTPAEADSADSQTIPPNTLPAPSEILTAPSSPTGTGRPGIGTYLTGLITATVVDMEGTERQVTRSDIVRVYLNSSSDNSNALGEESAIDSHDSTLNEYYVVMYKHQHLVWVLLLPCFAPGVEEVMSDQAFYDELEHTLVEHELEALTAAIQEDRNNVYEKSNVLGKHYKCFYYDNTTLNMKSTLINQQGHIIPKRHSKDSATAPVLTNDILLQLLDLKDDFEKIAHTSEIYTRPTSNYWIAGRRVYNHLLSRQMTDSTADEGDEVDNSRRKSVLDEGWLRRQDDDPEDYVEMYLVATKADTSLADVEDTLRKMTASLLGVMHIDA